MAQIKTPRNGRTHTGYDTSSSAVGSRGTLFRPRRNGGGTASLHASSGQSVARSPRRQACAAFDIVEDVEAHGAGEIAMQALGVDLTQQLLERQPEAVCDAQTFLPERPLQR